MKREGCHFLHLKNSHLNRLVCEGGKAVKGRMALRAAIAFVFEIVNAKYDDMFKRVPYFN